MQGCAEGAGYTYKIKKIFKKNTKERIKNK